MPGWAGLRLALLVATWASAAQVAMCHVQGSRVQPLSPDKVYTSSTSEGTQLVLAPNTAVHGTTLQPPPGAGPLPPLAQPEACGAECVRRGTECRWFVYCPTQASLKKLVGGEQWWLLACLPAW